MNDNPTAAELFLEERRLSLLAPIVSVRGFVQFHIGATIGRAAQVTAYVSSSYLIHERFSAPTWREAIALAEVGIAAYFAKHDATLIRRMSVAIIEITYDCNECSRTALVARGFTGAEIDRAADDACWLAGDMSSRGPFVVSGLDVAAENV